MFFKASFDKANRSSYSSFRGPGITEGLKMLQTIKDELQVPIVSDIHCITQVEAAAGGTGHFANSSIFITPTGYQA